MRSGSRNINVFAVRCSMCRLLCLYVFQLLPKLLKYSNGALCGSALPQFMRKAPYTLSVKLSDFTVWRHTWWKNWVNCALLTGNSAGPRTVFSIRLSHRELRSSLRESHSFLILPAGTTMASSQGTQPSKMNKREAILAFIGVYRSLPELWDTENRRYSYRVKKAAAYDTLNDNRVFIHHSYTHKKTHRTDRQLTNLMGNLCCSREHSVQFFIHSLT